MKRQQFITPESVIVELPDCSNKLDFQCIILPLQYDYKAELFLYGSKENKLTDKYRYENFKLEDVGFVEQ